MKFIEYVTRSTFPFHLQQNPNHFELILRTKDQYRDHHSTELNEVPTEILISLN